MSTQQKPPPKRSRRQATHRRRGLYKSTFLELSRQQRAIIHILRRYLRTTGADLAFLFETKCSKAKALRRIARLPLTNSEIVPFQGRGGGLWLLWADSISISILETSRYYIVVRIQTSPAALPWIHFAVYGDCDDRANNSIWERIEHYTSNAALPVCTIGNFNCISDQGEKSGGSHVFKSKHKRFRAFVQRSVLIDLGHMG